MTRDKNDIRPVVGVLAIQGDFAAHIHILKELKVETHQVRRTEDLDEITHLIIPGGESTTIRLIARADGYWEKLAGFKGPVMGTCMGSILMAAEIENPAGEGFGMIDMTMRRNAYGRQIDSFSAYGRVQFSEKPFEMVFIRAPRIVRFGRNADPIAWLNDEVTGLICGNKIALTFHPELTDHAGFHELFIGLT